jgi:hypothetical protein
VGSYIQRNSSIHTRRGLFFVVGVAGALLSAIPFFVSIVPPMTDVAQHVLVARIVNEIDDPILRYSDYFSIDWAIAPTSLFYLLLASLQKIVGPFWDARIYLATWIVTTWVSVWYLARVLRHRDPWIAASAILPLSFCWYAYKGFLPFLMTMPLFALTVAVWLQPLRPMAKVPLLWALLLTLFGFHIVGAAAAAAVICVSATVDWITRRSDAKPILLATVSVAPLVLVVGAYVLGSSAPTAYPSSSSVVSNVFDAIKFTCITLDNLASVAMLVWVALLGLVFASQFRTWRREATLLAAMACLMAIAAVMPVSLGSLWPAGPRLFPFVLILLVACIRWDRLPRGPVAVICMLLLSVLSVSTTRHLLVLDREVRDFIGGSQYVAPGSSVLPILASSYEESLAVDPFWALIAVYTVTTGGANPYAFAKPHIATGASPLHFKRESDRAYAFLYDPPQSPESYIGVSASYDYVLLWGDAKEVADVLAAEMELIYASGKATLFRSGRPALAISDG